MWLKNLFNRNPSEPNALPLFDESFLRRLERLSFRTSPRLRGAIVGERRSRKLRPALDFNDHRSYTVGDDLRHVDWRAYGRTEELFVRLGESSQSVDVHLLLDDSPSMSWHAPDQVGINKWDSARRLTGALGYFGLAGGERIHITPFNRHLEAGFGPVRGKRQIVRALQFLASVNPAQAVQPSLANTVGLSQPQTEANLIQNLTDYAKHYPRGGLLVLVSDLLDTAPLEGETRSTADKLSEGLRYLVPPRWQVLVIHLLTQQEVSPAFTDDLDLQDMETGDTLPFYFDEATLAQYRLRMERWCQELQSACAKRGATYARIVAEWPLEKMVVPYLRQRGVV
ncbi:DUF58 domain-containing protein [Anaerolineales bacterium HSG6]|nr:DUF58 domain-containing protein [Anaerolineales bacterium HSG6]